MPTISGYLAGKFMQPAQKRVGYCKKQPANPHAAVQKLHKMPENARLLPENCSPNGTFCPENARLLPENALNLIEALGFETARHVIQQLGGSTWRIDASGQGKTERAALIARIGEATYQQLQAHFKGETLYIPKCHKAMLEGRNESIRTTLKDCAQMAASRISKIRELVLQYRLSDRRIAQIAGAQKPDEVQGALF